MSDSSNIFEKWAPVYWDRGFSVLPIIKETKRPPFTQWQKYSFEKPSEKEKKEWLKKYSNYNIGLCLGPASNRVVAFDFDYAYDSEKSEISEAKFNADLKEITTNVLPVYLPKSDFSKVGQKGFTNFYVIAEGEDFENIQCDRWGVRCFDFLAQRKQTVLPPSIHPDTEKPYRWNNFALHLEDPESMEFIDIDLVKELKELLHTQRKGKSKLGGRHGELFKFALKIIPVVPNENVLAEKLVEKDKELHGAKAYLSDPKYFKSYQDPLQNALKWTERIYTFHEVNRKINGAKKTAVNDFEAYKVFFDDVTLGAKKCILSQKYLQKDDAGFWQPVEENIKALRSYAKEKGLSKADFEDNFYRYVFEKKSELLIDIPEWDGFDRIAALDGFVKLKHFDFSVFEDFLKDWGAGVFRRLYDNNEQNRCIILKGTQGLGKDQLIKTIAKGFGPYFSPFTAQANERDYWNQFSKALVVHIEEFEQTSKMPIGFLKDLITRNVAEFRQAYGRDDVKKAMRCSFISSVNFDDFLRDPTGNRRFAVFDLADIDWAYDKNSAQYLAQFKALYDEDYKVSRESLMAMKNSVSKYEQVELDPIIIEDWNSRIKRRCAAGVLTKNHDGLPYDDVREVVKDLAITYNMKMKTILSLLKKNGCSKKIGGNMLYYCAESEQDHHLS